MKSYTPPVVGRKPPKAGFFARLNGTVSSLYYEGRDPKENVYALWIESEGMGSLRCYPCVLDEAGDYLVYESVRTPETARENALLMGRWPLFLNGETKESFTIRELEKDDFNRIYQKYRNGKLKREYENAGLEAPAELDAEPEAEESTPVADPQAETQEG